MINQFLKLIVNDNKGTWGLAIIDRENPNQILVCRNGSPIQIGIHPDSIFIASEVNFIKFKKF